jgi:hypothetical protein
MILMKSATRVTSKDSFDALYGCLKDFPLDPLADLEAEHQAEIEADELWQPRGRQSLRPYNAAFRDTL